MFKTTTAQLKIAQLRNRVRVVQGGTSSSKTFSIIPLLITYAIVRASTEISIVSESMPHLRRGAQRDFLKIMRWLGLFRDNQWNRSNHTYTFKNGSYIEFFSADQPDRVLGARRDVLFVNECNNIPFETYNQLQIRTRQFVYLDYNPTHEFWVNTEVIGQEGVGFVKLNYLDNEALEPELVREIEKARERAKTSAYWANWWQVYGLGELGSLENVVFMNWKIIDTIPEEARLVGCGLDFGYSNDPSAAVEVYTYNGIPIVDQSIYQTEMLNRDLAARLPKRVPVYCDSAEPKSIKELQLAGTNAIGATKGRDSINFGIQVMQSVEYLVTSRSLDLIKELRAYRWDKTKSGNVAVGPHHAIDALRYHEMETRGLHADYGQYHVR